MKVTKEMTRLTSIRFTVRGCIRVSKIMHRTRMIGRTRVMGTTKTTKKVTTVSHSSCKPGTW